MNLKDLFSLIIKIIAIIVSVVIISSALGSVFTYFSTEKAMEEAKRSWALIEAERKLRTNLVCYKTPPRCGSTPSTDLFKINSKSEEVWRFYPQTGWEKAPTTRFYDGFIEIREEVMGLIIKTFMINRKTLTAEDGDGICEYSCKIITEKEMEAQEFLMMQEYTKEKDERLKGNQI